jgi:hypothetical protein
MFAALALLTACGVGFGDSFGYWALLWAVLFLLAGEMAQRLQLRAWAETALRNGGECTLSWGESGLNGRSNGKEWHVDWKRVAEIHEGNAWITIIFGETALHVPDSAFTPELPRESVVAQLRGFMEKAAAAPVQGEALSRPIVPEAVQAGLAGAQRDSLPSGQAPDEPGMGRPAPADIPAAPGRRRAALFAFLHQLWRVLTFRRPDARAFRPTPLALFLPIPLFFLSLLIPEILRDGWPGEMIWWNAGGVLQPFAFMALAAGFMISISGENGRTWEDGGRFWLASNWLLLLMPPIAWLCESEWFAEAPFCVYVPAIVLLCLFFRQMEPLAESRRYPGQSVLLAAATGFAFYIAYAAANSYEVNNLWISSAEKTRWESERPRFKVDEDVLYGQPRLLDEHIAALAPGKAGQPEIFFLGVAGYDQQVFLNGAT